jgi:DNA-binding NarL/FixJ family response regulator
MYIRIFHLSCRVTISKAGPRPHPLTRTEKILIIDDEPEFLASVSHFLGLHGFKMCGTSDGVSGLALARRERPDVIICDITMPILDGYGVLHALRADPELAGTTFLFLTGRGNEADLRHGMNLGADDYLAKPIGLPRLLDAVCARLARRSEQRAAANRPGTLRALGLTPRESEVLFWVVQGKTNPEIAIILKIGRSTVKTHLKNILAKTETPNRLSAASLALNHLKGGK